MKVFLAMGSYPDGSSTEVWGASSSESGALALIGRAAVNGCGSIPQPEVVELELEDSARVLEAKQPMFRWAGE